MIYDDETKKIIRKKVMFNAGLYKIFDELIVNARDEYVRCQEGANEV